MKIWDFLLAILEGDNDDLVEWIDYDNGIFKIVNKSDVSIMWGIIKNNFDMNYPNLTRNIRFLYNKNIIVSNFNYFCYKFGPKIISKLKKKC